MPNIKEKKGNIDVHYGTKSIKDEFDESGFLNEFWKMDSLKNFSRISINTRDKQDNCKDLLTLNRKFKAWCSKWCSKIKDVCFQMAFPDVMKSVWTLSVIGTKKGGLALKIYIVSGEGMELGKYLSNMNDSNRPFRGSNGNNSFARLNQNIHQMINNSKEVYYNDTIANWLRRFYEHEKLAAKAQDNPSYVVQKFNQGCYYHPSHESLIKTGYFKLIPWLNDRYLMLPGKLSVYDRIIVNTRTQVKSIIGNIDSQLLIPIQEISQLSGAQYQKLIEDWVSFLEKTLSDQRALRFGSIVRVSPENIVSSADRKSLEDYVKYILTDS